MNLTFIKADKCPICGCDTVISESIEANEYGIRVHANGERWESRKFLCGKVVYYVPNYQKELFSGECKNDPAVKERMKKVEEDKIKLLAFCEDNDIDGTIISRINNYVI